MLNKYSGKEDWAYSPGYYLFNTQITSSPAVYGDDIYVGASDGYIYALDSEKKSGPTSQYLYYIIGIIVLIILALMALRLIARRRKNT